MAKSLLRSLAVLPLTLAGCYHYVPTDHTQLTPATPISVELTTRGTVNVASKIGENVVAVDGNLTEANGSSLTLALQAVHRRGESAVSTWSGESITLTTDEIDQVKRRELSRGRTAVASAAVIAASVGVIVAIAKATGSASGGGGGTPPPNP